VLYARIGLGLPLSVLSAISLALGLSLLQIASSRGRERVRLKSELNDLYHSSDRLIRRTEAAEQRLEELGDLESRLEKLETNIQDLVVPEVARQMDDQLGEIVDNKIEDVKSTLVSEMQLIETLVKQLAEGVRSDGRPHIVRDSEEYRADTAHPDTDNAKPTPLGHLDDSDVLDMVRQSIEENKVDLYLQPVVTLPQRKVRFYEALTRLRSDDGELILPADYIRVAEPAGIMPMIDNLLLFRSVQVVRRLSSKNRAVGVFCNISPHSLVDADFFPQFVDFMEHNKALADSIFFELSQAMVNGIGPIEVESMSALAEHGFRFSMDHVTQLDFDAEELAERGFKFVKVPANLLLSDSGDNGAQIHPADLGSLLARHGITMIAEKIETESTVVNLFDFGVELGQGYLFAEPKPVRDEALADLPDKPIFSKVG